MYLPINLSLQNKKILVVGGGQVAFQKLKILIQFATEIIVLAPEIQSDIRALPVILIEKPFESADLDGASLVYACTNQLAVNLSISQAARERGVWVNVADNPSLSDFISPAVCCQDGLVVAVSSGGKNVKAAVQTRDRIADFLKTKKEPTI